MNKNYKIVSVKLPTIFHEKLVKMARWEDRSVSRQASSLIKLAINDYYNESKEWERKKDLS
ncbi:MAG: hypothetical protein H8E55_41160 [Pelagibacterales bacterium]|nr:hypothetical protein [Pelagibacterales bacterium]